VLFFFSSRRRHTRFSRDWSSDVCSSDLASPADVPCELVDGGRRAPDEIRPAALEIAYGALEPLGGKLVRGDEMPVEHEVLEAERSEERRVGKEGRSGAPRRRQK